MCDVQSLLGGSGHNARVIAIAQADQARQQAAALQAQQDRLYQQQLDAQNAQNTMQAAQAQKSDNTAAQAQASAQATAKQKADAIAADTGAVNSAFGQFNDDYYNGLVKSYEDANDPAVRQAAAKSKDSLVAALAGRGLAGSSVAGQELANFDQTTNDQLGKITSQGLDNANALRGSVANAKANFSTLANNAEDPTQFAADTLANSTALAKSGTSQAGIPSPSVTALAGSNQTPIGSLFGSLVAPFQAGVQANNTAGLGVGVQTGAQGAKAANPGGGSTYTTA